MRRAEFVRTFYGTRSIYATYIDKCEVRASQKVHIRRRTLVFPI